MGVLDIFKSSSKAVDTAAEIAGKATDGIIGGIDKAFYTDEEKADDEMKRGALKNSAMQSVIDFQKALMQESMPSALSRRILAWVITGVYLSLVLFSVVIWRFNEAWAKFVIDNGVARTEFAFSAVIATYFIYHGIKQAIKK